MRRIKSFFFSILLANILVRRIIILPIHAGARGWWLRKHERETVFSLLSFFFFFRFFLRDNRLLLLLQADPILLIQWPGENGSKVSASVLLPFSYRSPVVECDFNPLPVGVKRLTRNRGEVWLIR